MPWCASIMIFRTIVLGILGVVSCCHFITNARCRITIQGKINGINDNEADFCKVHSSNGIYMTSQLAIIRDVRYGPDCLLLCSRHKDCVSASLLKAASKNHYCILHSSSSRQKYQVSEFVWDKSTYRVLHCFSKYNAAKRAPKIDPGKPGDHCGETFFSTDNGPPLDSRSKRILNGMPFAPYSQPWMGAVTENGRQVCGASLVSKRTTDTHTKWAISAAHCFMENDRILSPRSRFGFIFGLHDIRVLAPYTIYRRPARIIVHGHVNYLQNDIALIYFSERIRFNNYVRPICLPGWNGRDLDVSQCSSCGWGSTDEINFRNSAALRCFVSSLSLKDSEGDLTKKIHSLLKVDSRMGHFEWKQRNMGFSYGDSGGPVSCPYANIRGPSRYMIYGINAAVFNAEQQSEYVCLNYFTLTSYYLRWIEDKMNGRHQTARLRKVCSNWRVLSCYDVEDNS